MRLWGGRFSEANDARVEAFTRSIDVDASSRPTTSRARSPTSAGWAGRPADGRRRSTSWSAGLTALAADVEAGHVRVGPGARGCPPQPRGGARRADRAGRRQAAHRPLAQRPGRDGPAALDPPRDRPPGRGDSSRSSMRSSASPSARARPSCPARPTSSRPSPSCSPITCSPTSRWSSATGAGSPTHGGASTSRPLGAGALAGAGYPLDREATAPELGFDGVTANSLDAVSDRDFVVEVLAAAALGMVHLSRLAEEITWWSNPRVRVRARLRRVLDRQLDHAQQEEPRSGRARPRPGGARDRRADRRADAAQGPAARVPARPPGGQAAAVRRGRRLRGVARRARRACSTR